MPGVADRYVAPGWFTRNVLNRVVRGISRLGRSPVGLCELTVVGRTSGLPRTVPVNVLELDGERYLVAPRGHTQWVRNLRAAGTAEVRVGRRRESITAAEVADPAKPPILRRYLEKWGWEVGAFFEDLDKKSDDAQLLAAAPDFPVFRLGKSAPEPG